MIQSIQFLVRNEHSISWIDSTAKSMQIGCQQIQMKAQLYTMYLPLTITDKATLAPKTKPTSFFLPKLKKYFSVITCNSEIDNRSGIHLNETTANKV